MTRTTTFDADFETWLQALPSQGYPRDWIRNNLVVLEQHYRSTSGAPMKPCPEPTRPPYDPYKGI